MRLCIKCRKHPAEVPDRERAGRPIKRICRRCHANRLRGDLKKVLTDKQYSSRGHSGTFEET